MIKLGKILICILILFILVNAYFLFYGDAHPVKSGIITDKKISGPLVEDLSIKTNPSVRYLTHDSEPHYYFLLRKGDTYRYLEVTEKEYYSHDIGEYVKMSQK